MPDKYTVKESITFALLQLMNIKPFEEITITAIVKKSGVCRASFYRNYKDKSEILENYIKYVFHDCPDYYPQQNLDIDKQISNVFSSIKENRLLFDMLKKNHLLHMLSNQINQMTFDYIHEKNIPISNYEAAYYSYSALGILIEWIKNDYEQTVEEITKIYLDFTFK